MGQYHYICNLDRREYLKPTTFGDGLKLLEFAPSGNGVMAGLAVLLAATNGPNGRGGGDLHPWNEAFAYWGPGYDDRPVPVTGREDYLMNEVVGRWAGDRIAIVGDYHDEGDAGHEDNPWANPDAWTDVSKEAIEAMRLDYYLGQEVREVLPA